MEQFIKEQFIMERGKFILVLGGARSGKSEFAEELAAGWGLPVTYVATAAAGDPEMARRIASHRERRPAMWRTVEETHLLPGVVARQGNRPGVVLVDCLTIWLSNLLLDDKFPHSNFSDTEKEKSIQSLVEQFAGQASGSPAHVIAVACEVGLGLVPEYPLGRMFRDLAGWANRRLAQQADEVYFVAAGLALEIKSRSVNLKSGGYLK